MNRRNLIDNVNKMRNNIQQNNPYLLLDMIRLLEECEKALKNDSDPSSLHDVSVFVETGVGTGIYKRFKPE